MTEEEFENMNCKFKCGYEPKTREPFEEVIDKSKFLEVEHEDHSFLFKLAAKEGLEKGNVVAKD